MQQVNDILLLYLHRQLISILIVMITDMTPTMIRSQVDPKTYNIYIDSIIVVNFIFTKIVEIHILLLLTIYLLK